MDHRLVPLCEVAEGAPVVRECEVGLLTDPTNRRVDADTRLAFGTGHCTVARRWSGAASGR